MRLYEILTTVLILLCSIIATSQEVFLVELENRSPSVQSLVMGYEGTTTIPFLANDMNGQEQGVMKEKGKNVILAFWHSDCPKCIEHTAALNKLSQKYPQDLKVISFANNTKEEIATLLESTSISYPIIPNSKTLSEGPYGGDLGYPKYFIVDKTGMIKWVIPEVEMRGTNFDVYNFLETLHISLNKN